MNNMNKSDLLDKLRRTEETILLELLDITSEELVDAFLDKIDERIEFIDRQLEEI